MNEIERQILENQSVIMNKTLIIGIILSILFLIASYGFLERDMIYQRQKNICIEEYGVYGICKLFWGIKIFYIK